MSSESEIEFWRLERVKQASGLSKSEIYRRVAARTFPPARKYPGTTKTFWLAAEVQQWQRDTLSRAPVAVGSSAT